MRRSHALAVIPARIGSERLARKPLHPLAGRPLIEWVWRRVAGFSALERVVVATDSEEVAAVCRGFGAEVELTRSEHASGTDRVAEVAARDAYREFDVIVNVQGDEPLIPEAAIDGALGLVREGWDVGTVATPLGMVSELEDPAVVKVVRRRDGGALYFSRAPIPHRREGPPTSSDLAGEDYLRHVGLYAFDRPALERWVKLPADALEVIERLEQLRALRAGLSIGVAAIERAEAGVDTEADASRVEARLRELEEP